jgi:hypothetical protein
MRKLGSDQKKTIIIFAIKFEFYGTGSLETSISVPIYNAKILDFAKCPQLSNDRLLFIYWSYCTRIFTGKSKRVPHFDQHNLKSLMLTLLHL